MNRMPVTAGLIVVLTCCIGAPQAGAQKCTPVPVKIWFDNVRPGPDPETALTNAILNDNHDAYVNGLDGVTAVLNTCNKTNNVTVSTAGNQRSFIYRFPSAVDGSSIFGGADFIGDANVFVRNILLNRPPCSSSTREEYSFTSEAFFMGGSTPYRLRFVGPNDVDSSSSGQFIDDNSPYITSNVTVTFHPGNCSDGPDSWTVKGYSLSPGPHEYLQLGTLHQSIKGKWVHVGQYVMPFQFHVQALVSFP